MSVGSHPARRRLRLRPGLPRRPTSACATCGRSPRREAYAADVTYGTNNEFGFDYLRDNLVIDLEQRVQRGPLLRDRRRGRQHPDRRGAHAADHLGPGGGIGRQVRPVRAPRPAPARRRRTTSSTRSSSRWRSPRPAPTRWSAGSASTTSSTTTSAWRATSSRPSRPRRSTSATATTSSRTARSIIVDEFTGRLMPGRRWSEGLHQAVEAKEGVKIQNESRTLATDHLPELLPHVRQAGRHDRYRRDRGGGVPQDLRPRGRGHPDQPADDPRRLRRPGLHATRRASGTRSSTRSPRSTRRGGRSWSARSASRSARCSATC